MVDIFEASRVKVERARKHIVELETFLAEHEAAKPPISTFTPATKTTTASLHVQSFAPRIEFGAIAGDVVHNLRASLDLMAVELVLLTSPATNPKRISFPFSDDATRFPAAIKDKYFDRAGTDAVALLENLKPYTGGNIALRGLHDLDISDKHSRLIPNAATMTTGILHANADNFPDVVIEMVEGSSPNVKTVFPDDWPFARCEIIPTLHELVELVESILKAFAGLVSART